MVMRSPFLVVEIPEVPFTGFVLAHARELGDKPTFIDATSVGTISYAQLVESVRAVAAGLGGEPGVRTGSGGVAASLRPGDRRGTDPAAIADVVADAIASDRFWILPHPEWVERAACRWHRISEGLDPNRVDEVSSFPPAAQIAREIQTAVTASTGHAKAPANG